MYKYAEIENKIINRFKYMNLKSIDVENTINSVIVTNNIKEYDTNKIYLETSNFYLYKIKSSIEEGNYEYLNAFIKRHSANTEDYKAKLGFLNKIISFLNMCNVNITFDLYVDIINNNKIVSYTMKDIIDRNRIVEKINTSDDVKAFIEVYVSLFDEVKEEKEEIDYTDYKDVDIVKEYLKELGRYPLLTNEEEYQLAIAYKENNDLSARDKLIKSNLKLVVNIAKRYKGSNIDFLDLIEDGNIGLIAGIEKYDPKKGFRISTYVTWWIRQSITRALCTNARTVRYPVHLVERINLYKKADSKLFGLYGRKPTLEEISEETGLSVKMLKELETLALDTVSLNALVRNDEDSDTELEAYISDPGKGPEETAIESSEKEFIKSCLDEMTDEKQRIVLLFRYGFIDGKCYTLEETAQKIYEAGYSENRLTRERIRQIEGRALRKIGVIAKRKLGLYRQKVKRID